MNLEYLKLGVTKDNLNSIDYDENPPFGNFLGQNDDKQEIRNDDGSITVIDPTAGSQVDQRTLVIKEGVDTSKLDLPSLWVDMSLGANVLLE